MTNLAVRRPIAIAAVCVSVVGGLVWASKARVNRAFADGRDPWRAAGVAAPPGHSVVVAELFTSEGCSSCPPADEVLSRLARGPVGGTLVLGLGEHVDYWNHLGWRDAFSSAAFSDRQYEYQGRVFRKESIYTPQLVVDGQFQAVGSDVSAVLRAIADAARTPKAVLEVAAWPVDGQHVSVHVQSNLPSEVALREEADVVVALTQDHLTNDVSRGENRGRKLPHSAVVRSLTALGSVKPPARTFDTTATVAVAADWTLADVTMVGLLQERWSRRIVGAGTARVRALTRPKS